MDEEFIRKSKILHSRYNSRYKFFYIYSVDGHGGTDNTFLRKKTLLGSDRTSINYVEKKEWLIIGNSDYQILEVMLKQHFRNKNWCKNVLRNKINYLRQNFKVW